MLSYLTKRFVVTALAVAALLAYAEPNGLSRGEGEPVLGSEARAVDFLVREVPAWSRTNGCFSCHNNGDGARALYAASRKGYSIDTAVLADTTSWLKQPKRWDENKGDPGFGDKHLASVQFSASLIAALNAGYIRDRAPLEEAARRLIAEQGHDGAWRITPETAIGSPATYGTQLATHMAQEALRDTRLPAAGMAIEKASRWLKALTPASTFTAATLLLASGDDRPLADRGWEVGTIPGLSARAIRHRAGASGTGSVGQGRGHRSTHHCRATVPAGAAGAGWGVGGNDAATRRRELRPANLNGRMGNSCVAGDQVR